MTLKELKKKWRKLRKKIPVKVVAVTGTSLPPVSLCTTFTQLSGREIALSSFPKERLFKNFTLLSAKAILMQMLQIEWPQIQDQIFTEIAMNGSTKKEAHAELLHQFYNGLTQAYINLMTVEASMGCVRVPVLQTYLRNDTLVSPSGNDQWNNSPVMHHAITAEENAIEQTAHLFAAAYMQEEPMSVITVKCKRAISPENYLLVQNVIAEFCELMNAYAQNEFDEEK